MGERFPNNSSFNAARSKSREEPNNEVEIREKKKLDTPAMKIKTPINRKLMDTFIQGDIKDVISHIIKDILIPSAIETLADMGHNLVDGMIFSDDSSSIRRRRRMRSRETSSLDRGRSRYGRSKEQMLHNARSLRFDDVALRTEEEAKLAIDDLKDTIEYYNRPATVTDFYSFIGWDNCIDHTTSSYGWYEIDRNVRPIKIWVDGEERWTINLPRAEYIGEDAR